jgi:Flp pilus assembly protein TadG
MKHALGEERGQVLVMGALMMTVLVGFLALVLDVGNAYAQRRFTQNAADAASIAGAQYMAVNRAAPSDPGTRGAVDALLPLNGGATLAAASGPGDGAWYVQPDGSPVSPVNGTGAVPSLARGVRVNATKTFSTYVAGILGIDTMTVKASATALYGAASTVLLDWSRTGMPVMPLAFDAYYYERMLARANCTYGQTINFRQPVDWASECVVDDDAHFGFTMLNIGNDCSNQTTKDVLDRLANRPESLGDLSVTVGETEIMVCSGARDTTWDYIIRGRPVLVPLIDHATAATCNSNCYATVTDFVYVRFDQVVGNGANAYLRGSWVDPLTQPPIPGLQINTTTTTITGPATYAIIR